MKIKRAFVSVLILSLSGCVTTYTHPTKNAQDFEREKYECETRAVQVSDSWGAKGNPLIIIDEVKRCLKIVYGWAVVPK